MNMLSKILKEENMKKLVVLSALLAMSSIASAGMVLTAGGVDTGALTLSPSDTVMIGLYGNADDPGYPAVGNYFVGVIVDGPGTLDLSAVSTANISYTGNANTIAGAMDPDIAAFLGVKVPYADIVLNDLNTTANPPILSGILVHDLPFHCDGPGEVIIRLFDGAGNPMDSLIITQQGIPEPMTLGLLGLGGLFLRRRLA